MLAVLTPILTDMIHWFIEQYIPVRQVTITEGWSTFTTIIKSILRKRNKLMRKNQLDKANNLRNKMGKLTYEHRSSILSQVDYRSSEEPFWATVILH
jgi:hypothetical protein